MRLGFEPWASIGRCVGCVHDAEDEVRAQRRRQPAFVFTDRAGIPTTVSPISTSWVTTAFAPTFALAPTISLPRIFAPAPTFTEPPDAKEVEDFHTYYNLRVA